MEQDPHRHSFLDSAHSPTPSRVTQARSGVALAVLGLPRGHPVFLGAPYLPGVSCPPDGWHLLFRGRAVFPRRRLPRARFCCEHWKPRLGSGRLGTKTRTPMPKRNPEKVGRTHAMREQATVAMARETWGQSHSRCHCSDGAGSWRRGSQTPLCKGEKRRQV